MSRKRKRNLPVAISFSVVPSHAQASGYAVVEHVEGAKVIRETAPLQIPKVSRALPKDFQGIKDLLGDGDDIRDLQASQEVIEHYIQQPGHKKKTNKGRNPTKFASLVSAVFSYITSAVVNCCARCMIRFSRIGLRRGKGRFG